MDDLIKLINEIQDDQKSFNARFPNIISKDDVDLSNYSEQKSDYSGVEFEYVNQSGDGDYGFHGKVAVPFEDIFIVFDFYE